MSTTTKISWGVEQKLYHSNKWGITYCHDIEDEDYVKEMKEAWDKIFPDEQFQVVKLTTTVTREVCDE